MLDRFNFLKTLKSPVRSRETLLIDMLLLDAGEDVTAFFHMIAAGFESLSNAPHIMMIPVKNSSFEKDGNTYSGYLTSEDNVGKKWFITMDGLLIGQV